MNPRKCKPCKGTGDGIPPHNNCFVCGGEGHGGLRYGVELILDLHQCDETLFTRKDLTRFFKELCDLIKMERADLHWWDDHGVAIEEQQTEPHLKGTSAIQFITTSNITLHTLDLLKCVYVNIFSCKEFDEEVAEKFVTDWFSAKVVHSRIIDRK